MGCAASRFDGDERVQICRERIRLMQQLMVLRGEFAESQLAYLRALRNTGVTLRQFTESESLELEDASSSMTLPPSPPPPLPSSPPLPPPPPPPFSPDLRDVSDGRKKIIGEGKIEIGRADECIILPPAPPSPNSFLKGEFKELVDDDWTETSSETEEEEEGQERDAVPIVLNNRAGESTNENSFMASWYAKESASSKMVGSRSKRTLGSIIKELDECFLKASNGGNDIAILVEINRGDISSSSSSSEEKKKRSNSAKVFSALSRSWSSKSLQTTRDAIEFCDSNEPCVPGAHGMTLKKLCAAEQGLYKEVKEEDIIKSKYERKLFHLQKQEEEDIDWAYKDNTRAIIESLGNDLSNLQLTVSRIASSILGLIDDELYPQLIALTTGLLQMWKTMYECHQLQNDISQQLSNIPDCQNLDLTSDYHRQATKQLETEVTLWYNNFCKFTESQQEYVKALCRWIQLTECLEGDQSQSACSSALRNLCKEWQSALERLPYKVTSEAIKSLLSAVRTILTQHIEESNLQKKSEKLEKRLQEELHSLSEMVYNAADTDTSSSPKNPLAVKRAKTDTLKKQVDEEKAKYLNSLEVSRRMTLNYLKTTLPSLFQALTEFSNACAHAFESVTNHLSSADSHDGELQIT